MAPNFTNNSHSSHDSSPHGKKKHSKTVTALANHFANITENECRKYFNVHRELLLACFRQIVCR